MNRTNFARAAIVSAVFLVLVVGSAAVADPATPVTITFTGTGAIPLLCGSRPDITSHQLSRGQAIILANLTGVEATVDVGGKAPLTVASGTGVSVKLTVGEHVLRMVPKCLLVAEVGQAVVVVTPGPVAGPTPGAPSPSGRLRGSAEPASPVAGQPGSMVGASGLSVASTGPESPSSQPTSSGAPAPGPGPAVGGDPDATTVPIKQPADERGTRLLAIIAAICVLGVTAGIIRAIVTHRTRVSLRTISTK